MGRNETIELLNVLLEAERAGVGAVADLARAAPQDPDTALLLEELAADEARYAAGLRALVTRLGGEPSPRTGDFVDKVRAAPTFRAKAELLDRGQRWVVRTIERRRADVDDVDVCAFLDEMRARHEQNVARSGHLLAGTRDPT